MAKKGVAVKSASRAGGKSGDRGPKEVQAYLRALAPGDRAALQAVREAIRGAAPEALEGFSYGLPAFRLDGRPLVCYGAAKNHCSFFPMSPALIETFAGELRAYDVSKGTIRFSAARPLPARLIRKFVAARIAELRPSKG